MNREQRRQAAREGAKAQSRQQKPDPRQAQIEAVFSLPVMISWSDGHKSKSTLAQCFDTERDYERFKSYKEKGQAYPVRVDAVEPTDPNRASSIFPEGTVAGEYELLQKMSESFTECLQKYLGLAHDEQLEQATAAIMKQAAEATEAMSKDIPDLEGAELKV